MGINANDAFDLFYFGLQGACLLVWLLAVGGLGGGRSATSIYASVAVVGGIVLPMVWNLGWPPLHGFEGAARILLGAPPSLLAAALGVAAAARTARQRGAPWSRAALRFAPILAASVAFWLWFLFRS
jgi:hypothetical protein